MATFKDSSGNEWTLQLDAPLIEAVREECKIDLVACDGSTQMRLTDDDVLLVDVLWRLCREKANDEAAFKRAMNDGDALDRAYDALFQATLSFCRSHKRTTLQTIVAKQEELVKAATAKALESVNKAEIPAELLNKLTRLTSATNTPES